MVWFLKAVGHRGLRFSGHWVEKRRQSCVGLLFQEAIGHKEGGYLPGSQQGPDTPGRYPPGPTSCFLK